MGPRLRSGPKVSRWMSRPPAFFMRGRKLDGDSGFAASVSRYQLETARDFFSSIVSGVRLTLRNLFDDRHRIYLQCRCLSKSSRHACAHTCKHGCAQPRCAPNGGQTRVSLVR